MARGVKMSTQKPKRFAMLRYRVERKNNSGEESGPVVHADHSFGDHCSDFLFLGPQERQEVMV